MGMPKGYVMTRIRKILDCYEDGEILGLDFDPQNLKEVGQIIIKINGIPKDDAQDIFSELLK